MKTARAIGLSAVAAALVLSGCSTATDGRAQQDTSTTSAAVCPSGTVQTKIGKCDPVSDTTTTSPSATTNANPSPALPSVSACDGTKCDLSTSDDETDRLVAQSLDDVAAMWKNLNVYPSLHLYKNGAADCPSPRKVGVDGKPANATAWTCVLTNSGGWNPENIQTLAAKYGATLSDAVRSIVAHEIGHIVLDGWNTSGDDVTTKELRADCLAAGYSRWTMTTGKSSMGQLPLERMKNVLHGSRRAAALDAGFTGTPKTCTEYTP
jgi:predicted metalloprotease